MADAVRAIGYTGAGTLEFLRDPDGNLWFMEMNVRLQVEHAVSEMLTLVDLVKWQIRTAAGVSLPFSQTDIPMKGAVIECRINALSPGTVSLLHVPGGRSSASTPTSCRVLPSARSTIRSSAN